MCHRTGQMPTRQTPLFWSSVISRMDNSNRTGDSHGMVAVCGLETVYWSQPQSMMLSSPSSISLGGRSLGYSESYRLAATALCYAPCTPLCFTTRTYLHQLPACQGGTYQNSWVVTTLDHSHQKVAICPYGLNREASHRGRPRSNI